MIKSFVYNPNAFGGTEYMARQWHKYIGQYVTKFDNYLSIIIPGITPPLNEIVESDKEIIIWMHNFLEQFDEDKIETLKNKKLIGKIKFIIVPSEIHRKNIIEEMLIDEEKVVVIPNAIEPLKFNKEKFNNISTIKLVHMSGMDRGLDVLVNSLNFTKENFRLEIYNDYYPDLDNSDFIFDERIKFYGKTPRKTVREAIESSHIHAYPSTFLETFCLSQVEAMSAGLLCVTSDLGALPEVSSKFGIMYPYEENKLEHCKIFAGYLDQAIQSIYDKTFDPDKQVDYINAKYSWDSVRQKWIELHECL